MVSYPLSLINEFARRRCILFLGAGVSATAKATDGTSPPSWKEFIESASHELLSDGAAEEKKAKKEVKKHIKSGDYTLALQTIVNIANRADYTSYIEGVFNSQKFRPSETHKLLMELDAKIIITTNFDCIYDTYCRNISDQGFKVITYDNETLSDVIRSDANIIIKAHGSIDNTANMIFTKSDYHKAKSKYWRFYEILKAIFLTHTIVFVGCGMSDPDFLEILEDVKITATSDKPHYALTSSGTSFARKKDLFDSYNINLIEYGRGHVNFLPALNALKNEVFIKRQGIGIT